MLLLDKHNKLKFTIKNYEFPDIVDCEYDSNWLIINVDVESKKGNFVVEGPYLLTREVEELSQWFENLSNKNLEKLSIYFMEPDLFFEVDRVNDENIVINVFFDAEFMPEFHISKDDLFFVSFHLSPEDLLNASKDLKEQLEKYPTRV